MDILTPGIKGFLRNRKYVREMSDFYLGRFSAMFEGWARRDAQMIRPVFGEITPQQARIHAASAWHYGRLASLCYREYRRRQKRK